MTAPSLLSLGERVEKASAESEDLFANVWREIFPAPSRIWEDEDCEEWTCEYERWIARQHAFWGFMEVGAWFDAAMTLIPDGLFPTIDFVTKRCWIRDAKGYDVLSGPAFGFAKSVPLSVVAAALKARASVVGGE